MTDPSLRNNASTDASTVDRSQNKNASTDASTTDRSHSNNASTDASGRSPRETTAAFWAALYDRDWPRIRSFFGPESIYFDVPTGPASAGVGPDGIEARLRLGLEGLAGYEHRPGVVAEGPDGVVVTEHTEVWTWPTGETVTLPFVSVQHVRDGVIGLWKDYWDFQTLMGAAPAAWHQRLDDADLSWVVDVTDRL